MNELIEKFTIDSYDAGPDGYVTPGGLMRIMQECACRHATILGRGFDNLHPQGLMWVLSRMRLDIREMPQWCDQITIRTWPSGANRIFFYREFVITDTKGNILLTADSAWSVVDFAKSRVCRANVFPDLNLPGPELVFENRPEKLQLSGKLEAGPTFKAKYLDLDMNRHVNNVRSMEWLLEYFDSLFRSRYNLKKLELNFTGQIEYNDEVTVTGTETSPLNFDLSLTKKETDRPVVTGRVVWSKE